MDQESHHMTTHYGAWGERFRAIASAYGLNVKSGAWNLHSMPHAGPHPWNYHICVLERMQDADELAQQARPARQCCAMSTTRAADPGGDEFW
jgi:HNH/ENDO VII superfamily nuclease